MHDFFTGNALKEIIEAKAKRIAPLIEYGISVDEQKEKIKEFENKMSNLETFRLEINDIDSQIFELLNQRHSVVKKIGQYKKENNIPVLDQSREKIIETKIKTKYQGQEGEYINKIYKEVMNQSKNIQY